MSAVYKRLLLLALPAVLAATLAGCGGPDEENVQPIGSTTTFPGQPDSLPSAPPKNYEGSGNKTLAIEAPIPGVPFVARLTNSVAGPFIVDSVDAGGQPIDNLVDTIGAYTGTVPVDFNPSMAKATSLDIQAPGAWKVELLPLSALDRFTTNFSGTGDDVIVYTADRGNATFARKGTGPVVVTVYPSLNGGLPDTLVNEKDDVETAVLLPSSGVVQVQTEGPWSFAPAG